MPLEIRELHIKVTVNQPDAASGEGSSAPPAQQQEKPSTEQLLANAVEQVMEILRKKEER